MKLQSHCLRRTLHLFEFDLRYRVLDIQKDCNRRHPRLNLFEQLQAFGAKLRRDNAEAGGVPTWPRKTVRQAGCDRIANDGHDDWNGPGFSFERFGGSRAARYNELDFVSHKLSGTFRQGLDSVLSPFPFDLDCFSFDVAKFLETIKKCLRA